MKNDVVLIENAHKDTIFMDVKTAYLSHRHYKFWDTKPVKVDENKHKSIQVNLVPKSYNERSLFEVAD
ncbi:MAG: hypothetical protein IJU69_06750 [Bacteroidales bacterium]|nr:hypothetical protein [Bacteroidales bacterium]